VSTVFACRNQKKTKIGVFAFHHCSKAPTVYNKKLSHYNFYFFVEGASENFNTKFFYYITQNQAPRGVLFLINHVTLFQLYVQDSLTIARTKVLVKREDKKMPFSHFYKIFNRIYSYLGTLTP